jgi:hypothetical protein
MGWLLLFGEPTLNAHIVGEGYFKHNGAKVEIYQQSNLFFGKVVGLKELMDKKSGNPFNQRIPRGLPRVV